MTPNAVTGETLSRDCAATPDPALASEMATIGHRARAAAASLALASAEAKTDALRAAAQSVRAGEAAILAANARDLAEAEDLSPALRDRLALDSKRLAAIAAGLEAIAELPDPVGRTLARWTRPNGLDIERVAVPLGVIGIIYESRPNVTADAGGLALKSGNAAILRGGSESFYSSRALAAALVEGLRAAGLPEAAIQLVPTRDRAAVGLMLGMGEYIDVIVPRGGGALVDRACAARQPDPGDRPSRRAVPHLCRRCRRSRQGAGNRTERQDAPGVDLRRDRDPAHRPQSGSSPAAGDPR